MAWSSRASAASSGRRANSASTLAVSAARTASSQSRGTPTSRSWSSVRVAKGRLHRQRRRLIGGAVGANVSCRPDHDLHELHGARALVRHEAPAVGPAIGVVMMAHIGDEGAPLAFVKDEADVLRHPRRPEAGRWPPPGASAGRCPPGPAPDPPW